MKKLCDYDDILTVDEITEILKIGKSGVYSLLKEGEIEHKKLGTRYLVPRKSIERFIERIISE